MIVTVDVCGIWHNSVILYNEAYHAASCCILPHPVRCLCVLCVGATFLIAFIDLFHIRALFIVDVLVSKK